MLLGSSYELSPDHFTGDLFALLAGLFYTFYLIAVDRARKTMAPMPVLAIATTAGALPLLLFAMALGEQILPGDWTPLILLSFGSQLVGQGLLVYSMGHLTPVVVGLGLLTQPAASAIDRLACLWREARAGRRGRSSADLHRPRPDPAARGRALARGALDAHAAKLASFALRIIFAP